LSFEKKLAPVSSGEQDFEPMVRVPLILLSYMTLMPNKSPEPTGIVAAVYAQGSSARRVVGCRWLSFFR
jgi:hypothetical protein